MSDERDVDSEELEDRLEAFEEKELLPYKPLIVEQLPFIDEKDEVCGRNKIILVEFCESSESNPLDR